MQADFEQKVRQAQSGDLDAFSGLVTDFQGLVQAAAFARLADFETARDVSQEVFLDAWVQLHQLREPRAFPAWLKRIVLTRCDRITRRRPNLSPETEAAEQPADQPGLTTLAVARGQFRALRAAVCALPPNERLVVALTYLAELTGQEAADFLDVPLSTVKKRLRSARQHLARTDPGEIDMNSIRPAVKQDGQRIDQQESQPPLEELVRFFLAIRAGDRPGVKQMLLGAPGLVDAVQDWDPALVIEGVLPFASRATALITAVERDDLAMLELLLDAGADPDGLCQCPTAESPVWAASVLNRTRHLALLLARGADPNRPSCTGTAPLHVAAMRGLTEAARLLLEAGARPDLPDHRGRAPAEWAAANGHAEVLACLTPSPSTPRVGTTPLQGAVGPILLTGVKALDLFCPLPKGGLVRVPFMAGVGMVVLLGELCHRMHLSGHGSAIWTGFAQAPFDVADWRAEMSELGLSKTVASSLADLDAAPEVRRAAFRRGLELAAAEASTGQDVLLILLTEHGFEADVEAGFPELCAPRAVGSITTCVVTPFPEQKAASWADLPAPYAAQIKLDRRRANRGLWPALDPAASMSTVLDDAQLQDHRHARIADQARLILQDYAVRDPEFQAWSESNAAVDPHQAVPPPPCNGSHPDDETALALIRYLAQPFFVAEPFSGLPGQRISRDQLLEEVAGLIQFEV